MKHLEEISKDESKIMTDLCGRMTGEECCSYVRDESKERYCPAVSKKCLADECAFFEIRRPYNDKRTLEARCIYAGKRALAVLYGEPKDGYVD